MHGRHETIWIIGELKVKDMSFLYYFLFFISGMVPAGFNVVCYYFFLLSPTCHLLNSTLHVKIFIFFKVLLSNNSFKIPTLQIHSFIHLFYLFYSFIFLFVYLFIYLLFYLRIYIYTYPFQNNLVKCDF